MIKIAICEDSDIERKVLKRLIAFFMSERGLAYELETFENAEELIDGYENHPFDLILLDIHMGKIDGVEAGRRLRALDTEVEIAYCTSSKEFAIAAYEIHALGYLLKPYEPVKISAMLDYFVQKHPQNNQNYIEVKSQRKSVIIPYKEIIYAESDNKVVYIHTTNKGDIKVYNKLDILEEQMRDGRFLRCHQSYLVNMDYVAGLVDFDFIMMNDDVIPIRKSGRKLLVKRYEDYYKRSLKESE